MNLAIRGIEVNLGRHAADTFHSDLHPDLRVDFILANPPFNMSDWGGDLLADDGRWRHGLPPAGNANYAWVQHMVHHLNPRGHAGFVLANGSMSTNTTGEGTIRRALVEADLVDCMVALPPQLFYNTQIPACLWFLNRAKPAHRRGQTLFIDTRSMGTLISRVRRELDDDEIAHIANTYHDWLESNGGVYEDVPGFCKSATLEDVAGHGYVLTPGRYVRAADTEDDGEPFEEKIARLTAELAAQFVRGKSDDLSQSGNGCRVVQPQNPLPLILVRIEPFLRLRNANLSG